MTEESEQTDPAADPAVLLRDVAKRYGWTWALRDVDLEIDRGALVALVGPNGAGKTTLLQIVATLASPTRGDVAVLGRRPADDADAVRRRTGYLAARGYLYDDLTALENLRFASLMSGTREWEGPARSVLARVGLRGAGDLRVRGFSSGMRKRLALARLLLRPPELALLDEPYASLDRQGVELVDDVVEEMHAAGAAILMASHQWGRSLEAADRVVVLRSGELVWDGTPAEHVRKLGRPSGAGRPGPAPGAESGAAPATSRDSPAGGDPSGSG